MANQSSPSAAQADVDIIAVAADEPAYVDWSAVLAGTAIASAMSLLLYGFGASVGLYVAQPWSHAAVTTTGLSLAVIIFAALSYIYSLALGSYFAGRMRPRHSLTASEVQFRDGATGFIVWAISLIVGAFIASNVLVGATDRVAAAGYHTAAGVSSAVAPFAQAAVDDMLRAPTASRETKEIAEKPAQKAPSEEPSTTDTPPAASAEISAPAERAMDIERSTVAPENEVSADADFSISEQQRSLIGRIVARSLNDGEISATDKRYLANVLETEFGYTPKQALITVNQKMDQAIAETKEFLAEAKANTSFAGFWTAVVVLLSGMASWWAATLGGAHRDESR